MSGGERRDGAGDEQQGHRQPGGTTEAPAISGNTLPRIAADTIEAARPCRRSSAERPQRRAAMVHQIRRGCPPSARRTPDLAGPLDDGARGDTVNPHRGEQQAEAAEDCEQDAPEPLRPERIVQEPIQRADARQRLRRSTDHTAALTAAVKPSGSPDERTTSETGDGTTLF